MFIFRTVLKIINFKYGSNIVKKEVKIMDKEKDVRDGISAENFCLMAVVTDDVSDNNVELVFQKTIVENEDDIKKVVHFLRKHRPNLFKKLEDVKVRKNQI